MFERLRENHPSATFYVLCSDTNRPALDLLDIILEENVITMRTGSAAALIADAVRAVRRMRALRLDAVLDLELFARVSAVLAGLSGARIRAGFHRFTQEGLYRGNIMNRPVLYNPYQHIANQFVTLAEAISSTDVPTAKREVVELPLHLPPLALRADEREAARDALYQRYPSLADRPLVFMSPGGGLLPIRAWPLASFAAVAQALIARGCAVAILGTTADRDLAQTLQRACGSSLCIDLTGYTSTVREVTVLLHLQRQDELRVGRFGEIGAGRDVRRNRSDGEDAGVGEVARQRREERRVDRLQRQRRLRPRHSDARDLEGLAGIDGGLNLRLRSQRQRGRKEKCE